jgi:hypothetical protein
MRIRERSVQDAVPSLIGILLEFRTADAQGGRAADCKPEGASVIGSVMKQRKETEKRKEERLFAFLRFFALPEAVAFTPACSE